VICYTSSMRLFIAFEIPEQIKEHLICLMEDLKPLCNGARWVRREDLHITLAFLGETDPSLVPVIADVLEDAACNFKAQNVRITHLGTFPNTTHASVLWTGIEKNPQLFTIADVVRKNLSEQNPQITFDAKPFKPHITLARFKIQQNISTAIQKQFQDIAFTLNTIVLYETVWLHGGGHRYEKRASVSLEYNK